MYNGPNEAFNDVDYQFDLPQTFGYASESVASSYGSPAESTIDEVSGDETNGYNLWILSEFLAYPHQA